MNQKTFNEVVTTTLEACKSTLTKKRDEYVTDIEKDVLSNFKNNSDLSIVGTPEGIAWELLTKHLQSIKDYCSGREVSKEVLDEKIGDSINYLLLIKGLLIERGFASKPSQAELVEGLVDKLKQEIKVPTKEEIASDPDKYADYLIGKKVKYVSDEKEHIYTKDKYYKIVETRGKHPFGIVDNIDKGDNASYCTYSVQGREYFLKLFDFTDLIE